MSCRAPNMNFPLKTGRRPPQFPILTVPAPVWTRLQRKIPLVGQSVHAGFPSPADDFIEDMIDLNEVLIQNLTATYLWKVVGDCMVDVKIVPGDVVVDDRSLQAENRISCDHERKMPAMRPRLRGRKIYWCRPKAIRLPALWPLRSVGHRRRHDQGSRLQQTSSRQVKPCRAPESNGRQLAICVQLQP